MSDVDDYDEDRPRFRWLRDLWIGGVDERVYAAFRIAFSIVALANLIHLFPCREALFSGGGMISAEALNELGWHTHLSIFSFVDSGWGVTMCFALAAVAMICLGLGISARAAAIAVFVWHLSFTYRALPGTTGWDFVLRSYSFLVMVSPLGLCWRLRSKSLSPTMVPAYGVTLMRVQLLVIYWQTVVLKLGNTYWQEGEFLTYFLMSNFARWPHERVAGWNDLLIPVTYIALLIEIAIPILLFVRRTRKIGFVVGVSFHLLIGIVGRHIWLFSATMWMTYVAFVTPGMLDRVERLARRIGDGVPSPICSSRKER